MNREQIEQSLDIIGQKVGELITASQPITEELVQQYALDKFIGCGVFLLIAVFCIIIFAMLYSFVQKNYLDISDDLGGICIAGIVVSGIAAFVTFVSAMNLLRCALTPELHLLLQLVK